jgi:hypothetical protein
VHRLGWEESEQEQEVRPMIAMPMLLDTVMSEPVMQKTIKPEVVTLEDTVLLEEMAMPEGMVIPEIHHLQGLNHHSTVVVPIFDNVEDNKELRNSSTQSQSTWCEPTRFE